MKILVSANIPRHHNTPASRCDFFSFRRFTIFNAGVDDVFQGDDHAGKDEGTGWEYGDKHGGVVVY